MKNRMKMAVLSVCLREDQSVVRMGPKRYLEGLRARRTGTLHIDGWDPRFHAKSQSCPRKVFWWSSVRKPEYVSLEDVRTFSVCDASELFGGQDTEMPDKEVSGFRGLDRDRKAVLARAWMPRETGS